MKPAIVLLSFLTLAALPQQAAAWGDEGHQVVALIARSFLETDVRKRVNALLAADTDSLTAHDKAGDSAPSISPPTANMVRSQE
jgi:hypothetical protein